MGELSSRLSCMLVWVAVSAISIPICSDALAANTAADGVIEEVVVTGLRREETVLTTPASITALSSDQLRAKGIADIQDIQHLVPSLQYGEFLGRRQVAIRGVGEFVDAPGVMVSVDGIVQAIGTSSA